MRMPLVLCLLAACTVAPDTASAESPQLKRWEWDIMQTRSFVAGHPDLYHRDVGLKALETGDHEKALVHLRRAARFADKPAQALLAELHFDGRAVPRDRAIGYVWMDLAAERGYEGFLVLRERYWAQLSEAEREDALRRGPALFDMYGDTAAVPRLGQALRRVRTATTGSRTGSATNLTVQLVGEGISVQGSRFYARRFWRPSEYLALQDSLWMTLPEGRVDAGELENVRNDAPAKPR